jgi:hypothetical protein
MVFQLMQTASRHWRALNDSGLLSEVIKGTVFGDGIRKEDAADEFLSTLNHTPRLPPAARGYESQLRHGFRNAILAV